MKIKSIGGTITQRQAKLPGDRAVAGEKKEKQKQ